MFKDQIAEVGAWCLVGAGLAFGVVTGFSIGPAFIALAAVIALFLMIRGARDVLTLSAGGSVGAGAALLASSMLVADASTGSVILVGGVVLFVVGIVMLVARFKRT